MSRHIYNFNVNKHFSRESRCLRRFYCEDPDAIIMTRPDPRMVWDPRNLDSWGYLHLWVEDLYSSRRPIPRRGDSFWSGKRTRGSRCHGGRMRMAKPQRERFVVETFTEKERVEYGM